MPLKAQRGPSKVKCLLNGIKRHYFTIIRIMISDLKTNVIVESFIFLIQLCQLLSFPFHPSFSLFWNSSLMPYVYQFNSLCRLIYFYEGSTPQFILMFFTLFLYVIWIVILFAYLLYRLHKEKPVPKWISSFLAMTSHLNTTVLFIPLLSFFNFPFDFTKDAQGDVILSFSDSIRLNKLLHGFMMALSSLGLLFHLFMSYVLIMTYFEVIHCKCPRAMVSPYNLVYSYLGQSLLVGFEFSFKNPDLQWFILGILMLCFGFYLFRTLTYCTYYNPLFLSYEIIKAFVSTWAVFILFIVGIFFKKKSEGSFYLFLVGSLGIVLFVVCKDFNKEYLLFYSIEDLSSSDMALCYVVSYLKLIEETSRKRDILIKGYIDCIEERCTIPQCPLKRYLLYQKQAKASNDKTKAEMKGFLIQHGQLLYEAAISKYPHSIDLKIYYAVFIYEKLPTKKDLASTMLSLCDSFDCNLTQQFLIYRFKALMDDSIKDEENKEEDDLAANFAYNSHNKHFKNIITLTSTFYTEFWAEILRSNNEDFPKLNDYGTKISKSIEDLKYHFTQMLKLKVNNETQIFFYTQFLRYVLNDEETANKLLKKYNMGDRSELQIADHSNFLKKDFHLQFLSEEKCYLFISSREESFGVINHVSVKVSALLGYTRTELIGKSFQQLLPDFASKQALAYLHQSYKNYLHRQCDITPTPEDSESALAFNFLFNFVINKSKYIIPLCVQFCFLSRGEERHFILIELKENQSISYNNILKNDTCHILTNPTFVIQHFTSNCLNVLKLSTKELNNSIEINSLIQEFQEEYLHNCVNLNICTPEAKIQLKRNILETRFKNITNVSWTHNPSFFKSISNYFKTNMQMNHEPLLINGELVGYGFRFVPFRNSKSSQYELACEVKGGFDGVDLGLQIDKLFLPEAANRFALNPDKMAFMLNTEKEQIDQFRAQIRGTAMMKIQHQTQVLSSLSSMSNSDFSELKSGDYSLSYTDSSLNDSQLLLTKTPGQAKNNSNSNSNRESNDVYYHVDMSRIKYLQYNYELQVIQECANYNKCSQCDLKLKGTGEDEDSSQTYHDSFQYPKGKRQSNNNIGNSEDENLLFASKDKVLNRQIHHALRKDEVNDLILRMRFFSFVLFIFFLLFNLLFMYMMTVSLGNLEAFFDVIDQGISLIYNFLFGMFYARELTSLNSGLYKPLFGNDYSVYKKNCTDEGLMIYNESIKLLNNITKKMPLLSEDTLSQMQAETVPMQFIKLSDDKKFYYSISYNVSARGAWYEAITALKSLVVQPIEEIFPTNRYVFFFMNNTMNEVYLRLTAQIELYQRDAQLNGEKDKLYVLLCFLGGTVYCVIAYSVIYFSYRSVVKRKNAFLRIFLDIDSDIISILLKKCEYFLRQIQTDNLNDLLSNEDKEGFEDRPLLTDSVLKRSKSKMKKHKKIADSRDQKMINLKILLFFLLYWVFCIAVSVVLRQLIEEYLLKMSFFVLVNEVFYEHITYFSALREFIFFTDNIWVLNKPIKKVLSELHQEIINDLMNQQLLSSGQAGELPIEAAKVFESPLCSYSPNFFKTFLPDRTCDELMAQALTFGLETGLDYFRNQLRSLSNLKYVYENNRNASFKYNNTLFGTKLQPRPPDEENQELYDAMNSMGLLKENQMRDLTLIVLFVLRPFFRDFHTYYIIGIRNELIYISTVFIVTVAVFTAFLVALFLFIWRPFERHLNKTMTKTKNMLSIIPTEVLSQIKDIQELLDINQAVVRDSKIAFNRKS